ncbi:BREX-1 system adenine-specific DNA-methyltransferase PglX [Georgenia sp. Marseille-Q6866]
METAPLKNFATWARTALIREVTARIAAVLAPGSSGGVEQAKAVAALEKAIAAFGGGSEGRAAVADKVAYTWFNRIIALRFMDANGYTGIGVVSPQAGVEVGQPEVLAEAKRGVIDAEVVSDATRKTVAALLDGTLASGDPQGEAYALLLADYCRYWNKAMPFIFEREGDFTELLIPANLLADDSVLNRSVKVLTEDVCQDVEVIGWLYQFYISERKDEVFAGFKKNKKAGAAEIPAATQLFTPHWIVRYLVENSLGRLWMLNHPNSGLVSQMDYYIAPVDEETDFLKITKPEELKVIDPACGSGHMLTYAFDLLYAIYEEEGYAPSEIPGLILTHNLYGTEIDPRAGALAAFALIMKARDRQRTFFNKQVAPNICVIEPISFTPDELGFLTTKDGDKHAEEAFWNQFAEADTLGSLIQPDANLAARLGRHLDTLDDEGDLFLAAALDWAQRAIRQAEILSNRYSVLVANPPYMDARNMGGLLYDYVAENFPEGFTGMDLAFALRSRSLVEQKAFIGLLSMDSWLGNAECADFRDVVRDVLSPRIVLHLGSRAFPEISGEVVQVSATLFQNNAPGPATTFIAATGGATVEAKIAQFRDKSRHFTHALEWFDVFPGRVFSPYSASEGAHRAFASAPSMTSIAEVRTGLQTGDNAAFLRRWFEVSVSTIRVPGSERDYRWAPYVKSSSPTRWFAREDLVVDWRDDGAEIREHPSSVVRNSAYYFRPGLSYGGLAGSLKARLVSGGAIFDQKNSMVFPVGETTIGHLLALMNSAAFEVLARLVSAKGFGVGTLAQLPIPKEALEIPEIEAMAQRAIDLSRTLFDRAETSTGFVGLDSIFMGGTARHPSLRLSVESIRETDARIQSQLWQTEEENARLFQTALLAGAAQSPSAAPLVQPYSLGSTVRDLISYAVGCMFGRYSLDAPGLILADQGATLQDYLANVPMPTFGPEADNVIPIVEGDWFEGDIVERFRQFLRAAFGDEHFDDNLRFVTESLGVKSLRDYFVRTFYRDHWQRYKKRPIYWLFSSPKGSFNVLIYMHRYTPSTVSTVLNEYLREFQAKLKASLEHAERSNNAKEADRLRKVLLELDDYEHNVLYPLAAQNIEIDLDDGVKANYPKFGAALKKIPGLEAS